MTELQLTVGWVAEAVGGVIRQGDPGLALGPVATDTRRLRPGDFFVALRGSRYDAHAFVGDAFARGASAALVERGAAVDAGERPVVEVDDTTRALQDLARAVRRAAGTRVIAITGSAGKTTTKEACAELLSARFTVVRNRGNLNNHIGLPLSLLELRTRPEMAVMELGMNHAGEIRRLVAIAEPDVRVWTNVGDAHLGFFASPDAIADAKAEILEGAAEDDVLVANADDARVMSRVSSFAGRTLTFGLAREAAVRAHEVEDLGLRGTRARVTTPAGEIRLESPLLGRGNLSNVLAATAVAVECGIAPGEIEPRVRTLRPAERRGVVHRLRDDVTVIDDSYNSSPSALRAALEVLSQETPRGRRIAVLGEMLELGDHAIAMHEACGRLAAASGIQLLFAVGGAGARALAGAAIDGGLPAASVTYFETSEQAAREIPPAVHGGDLLLVKGSRGIRTDLVTDALMAALA